MAITPKPNICRRILLFLDGTWNEDDEKQPATNIVYLRERLFWGFQARLRAQKKEDQTAFAALPSGVSKRGVSGVIFDGFEYIVYYDRGVGTGSYWDVVKGGVTGEGLDDNIREAYRFLSFWFRPGDEIYIFGFSRGAFTARSLCGLLQASGLLHCDVCDQDHEDRAWNFYRTSPGSRLSADWLYFRSTRNDMDRPLVYDEQELRIRALCVFDTVGALGIPVEGFRRVNRAKYEFHDPEANSIVDVRLHAVAIDEPRWAFSPTLWTKPKFKIIHPKRSPTEQVWFPGAHADVGGGYVKWNQQEKGLSHLPLTWMLQRLHYHIVNTPPLAPEPEPSTWAVPPQRDAPIPFFTADLLNDDRAIHQDIRDLNKRPQHKPWAVASAVRPDGCRLINQLPLPKWFVPLPGTGSTEETGRVPHADPIGEYVHAAALGRLKDANAVRIEKGRLLNVLDRMRGVVGLIEQHYRPRNLVGVIPYIAATYLHHHEVKTPWATFVVKIYPWKQIRIVDWDGTPLDPEIEPHARRAFELLPQPGHINVAQIPEEMKLVQIRAPQIAFSPASHPSP